MESTLGYMEPREATNKVKVLNFPFKSQTLPAVRGLPESTSTLQLSTLLYIRHPHF